jgi:hypothetical protein
VPAGTLVAVPTDRDLQEDQDQDQDQSQNRDQEQQQDRHRDEEQDRDGAVAKVLVRWPRQSRAATAALVLGILAIPFGLLVYPGVLLGAAAVLCGAIGLAVTRRQRALGRARAGVGLVAGLVALTIALSLGWQGLRTARDCADRVGHRPSHAELETCIHDGL